MKSNEQFDAAMEAAEYVKDTNSEAMAAIEISLDQAGGNHSDALDLILTSEKVSGEAKAVAAEVLSN